MRVSITSKGSFRNTRSFLNRLSRGDIYRILDSYGHRGTSALAAATPVESGETAAGWSHEVQRSAGSYAIVWSNSHVDDGQQIAVLLQYGHGTGTGGYVQGRDYINPAIQPIFDEIANSVWKEVTRA